MPLPAPGILPPPLHPPRPAGGFSVFAGVGERTREGNDLYREMIESGGCTAWVYRLACVCGVWFICRMWFTFLWQRLHLASMFLLRCARHHRCSLSAASFPLPPPARSCQASSSLVTSSWSPR